MVEKQVERHTFVVSDDTARYLEVPSGRKVTRGWLQEEKWFLWRCVVQLLDMSGVVSADGDNLEQCYTKQKHFLVPYLLSLSHKLSCYRRHGLGRGLNGKEHRVKSHGPIAVRVGMSN